MLKLKFLAWLIIQFIAVVSCKTSTSDSTENVKNSIGVLPVDKSYFENVNPYIKITTVACTLSDGTKTKCYEIVTNSTPTDHQMGPWCPENINDDASMGGIWLENGKVFDVDGAFVKNLAVFYDDDTWRLYDREGNIYVTQTKEDCINAANPNVGEEYENFCVECLPSYITEVLQSYLIPINPVLQKTATLFRGPRKRRSDERLERDEGFPRRDSSEGGGAPPGQRESGVPSTRGIALNGVEFSAPAPTDNILGAYTLAPFDDAGGHINIHQGYHYHAATGLSAKIEQEDGHAALIGYALDGIGIYEHVDTNGNKAVDLDELRGHSDNIRGYHYHVDQSGANNFINGLKGAYAK